MPEAVCLLRKGTSLLFGDPLPDRLNVRGVLRDVRLADCVEVPTLRRVDRGNSESFAAGARLVDLRLKVDTSDDEERLVATDDRVVPVNGRDELVDRVLRDGCKVFGDLPVRENVRLPLILEPPRGDATERLVVALLVDLVGVLVAVDRLKLFDRDVERRVVADDREERPDEIPPARDRVARDDDLFDRENDRDELDLVARDRVALDLEALDLDALDLLLADRPEERRALERVPRERALDDLDLDLAPVDRGRLFMDDPLRDDRLAR